MKRDVLIVPLEELYRQFETNERQDVKIVAPSVKEKFRDVVSW